MISYVKHVGLSGLAWALVLGMAGDVEAQLPHPGMTITSQDTALVITDPQNDFLSPKGAAWGVVGKSVQANNTALARRIGGSSFVRCDRRRSQ